jgi:hypothetical protein
MPLTLDWVCLFPSYQAGATMAREELKWQNIDADDLPAEVKRSFDAMVEAEALPGLQSREHYAERPQGPRCES